MGPAYRVDPQILDHVDYTMLHRPRPPRRDAKTATQWRRCWRLHNQTLCNTVSRSRVERRPRSIACVSKKTCADLRPSSCSREKNSHSALSLEEAPSSVNISLATRWMRMPAHCAPSLLPGLATCRSTAIMRSSFSSTALKDTSFKRLRISDAERGDPSRSTGLI